MVASRLGLIATAVLVALVGCTTGPIPLEDRVNRVSIDRANFRVVKNNIRGEDYGFYFLGIIPMPWPSRADAMDRVNDQLNSEGHAVTLVNMTEERQTVWFIVGSVKKIVVRADAIEFLPEAPGYAGQPRRPDAVQPPASPATTPTGRD
jgi:hypothetical protein